MASWKKCIIFVTILTIHTASGQELEEINSTDKFGVCRGRTFYFGAETLNTLKGCTIILGNLKLVLMSRNQNFTGLSFPELKEVTGFVLFYHLRGVKSLGELFPNLTRIRGVELFWNYALIVHDMTSLQEIGLHSLIKIDRGSVIIYVPPTTCFINTINWNAIAPNVRHVIGQDPAELSRDLIKGLPCTTKCTCSTNFTMNYCWNNRKCQRFVDGPEGENCHEQCLGCRKTRKDVCSVCRYYTHQRQCVPVCPEGTYVMEELKYCLTEDQCHQIYGWVYNNNCVLSCPVGYDMKNNSGVITCEECPLCAETCGTLYISSISAMQNAQRCVYINGSLIIQVRAVTEAMVELQKYLTRIKEVKDFIFIYNSYVITSLDFLPSLRLIGGKNLKKGQYSLLVYEMSNLQSLFTQNVTKNLKIEGGTAGFYNNPMLCKSKIDEIKHIFPVTPNDTDIPNSMNGYNGSLCNNVKIDLKIEKVQENSALITFSRHKSNAIKYSVLYMRTISGQTTDVAPETCTNSKWQVVNVEYTSNSDVKMSINHLKPATNYVCCIEVYNSTDPQLARTPLVYFKTKVGRPQPPFLTEVVAKSANTIVLHWVNHKDYSQLITHYVLDVTLTETSDDDVNSRDQCKDPVSQDTIFRHYEYSAHAVVTRPPEQYEQCCETRCGMLAKGTPGAMVEEDFDPCLLDLYCDDVQELEATENKTFSEFQYYSSVSVNINGSSKGYQVVDLAPFRDYRVRLRACINYDCSRSSRRVVRTKALFKADLVRITKIFAYKGTISVEWDAPKLSNGPVLSYSVQIKPRRQYPEVGLQIPQDVCVLNNQRSAVISTVEADSYILKVCTTTLAPGRTCTEYVKVYSKTEMSWWLWSTFGILVTIVICIISCYGHRFWYPLGASINRSYRKFSNDYTVGFSNISYSEPIKKRFVKFKEAPKVCGDVGFELITFNDNSEGTTEESQYTDHNNIDSLNVPRVSASARYIATENLLKL